VDETQQTLAEQLAEAARALVDAGDVYPTLQRMLELAVETVAGCDHAGISLVVGDHIATPAQSDQIPAYIDLIRSEIGEGFNRDALRAHEAFASGELAGDQRHTRFSSEVVARTGVRSMLSLRLFVDENTLGALNLYANAPGAFDEDARSVASIFATHAALALDIAQQRQTLTETSDGEDVEVIAQAKGLIMERDGVNETVALAWLRDASHPGRHGVSDVAEQVVARELER
jgi:GAF domain-containing protein